MEKRKNPEKDMRNKSGLFFQIGLLVAMASVVSAFEFRTAEVASPVTHQHVIGEDETLIPITKIEPPKPPKPVLIKTVEATTEEPTDIDVDIIIDLEGISVDIPEPIIIEEPKEVVAEFVDYAEERPTPVGGYEAFYKFVNKNIKYPPQARRMGIGGKVFVRFIIDTNGNISKVESVRKLGFGLDEEAIRVLKASPAWKPGRQGGRKVNVRMVIPIAFELGQ